MEDKFQITIKNLKNGKVEIDKITPAIVGSFTTTDSEKHGTGTVIFTACSSNDLLAIMIGLEEALDKLKREHIELALLFRLWQSGKNSKKQVELFDSKLVELYDSKLKELYDNFVNIVGKGGGADELE